MGDDSDFGNIELPYVTVFGAGIAGLSAAHELVERGFRVQVVEPSENPTHEYECAVGGLAANQFTRVRAALQTLHPWLFSANNLENLKHALKFRDWRADVEKAAIRFPLNQKLRFDKLAHCPPQDLPHPIRLEPTPRGPHEPTIDIPTDWREYWDAYGVLNSFKLNAVFNAIREASQAYTTQFFPDLAALIALGEEPKLDEWHIYSPIHDTDDNAREFVARETFFINIVAYTDTDNTEDVNRVYAGYWATQVRDALLAMNQALVDKAKAGTGDPMQPPIWELKRRLGVVVRGSADARKDPIDLRQRSFMNRIEFEVVEQIIPGEHGFRFFPGFYRHLFDTMKRTPFYDERGAISSSAYDQLVPTPHPQLALQGGLYEFDFRNIGSLTQLQAAQDLLINKLGFKPKDVLGLQFKTLRYLTSGGKRRESEAEPINLFSYLGGQHPERCFSGECLDFIDRAPRALAAMSARESDARTQLDITAQLLLPGLPDPMTLNGPPSLVWLNHWKTYLKERGVSFFIGQIDAMQEMKPDGKPARYVPKVSGLDIGSNTVKGPVPEDPDGEYREPTEKTLDQHRFVLATQFQNASAIIWAAYKTARQNGRTFEGPFRQLIAFDELSGRRKKKDDKPRRPARDPATGHELGNWPLRTISGLQLFFPQAYRFGQSNIYFGFSPYGLTSISQYAFWRRSQPVGQLLGQISVDIGDWHSPYPAAQTPTKGAPGPTAFYSSSKEIVTATWAQIKNGLARDYVQVIDQPRYYHLDTKLVFSESKPSDDPKEPGWWSAGAVRANAVIVAPDQANASAPFALATGRRYKIVLSLGADGPTKSIETEAPPIEQEGRVDPAPLRDLLLKMLQKEADSVVMAVAGSKDTDIVMSPIVTLTGLTLRVTSKSDQPFAIWIEKTLFSAEAPGCGITAIVDAIEDELANNAGNFVQVTRVAPDAVTIIPLPNLAPMSFAALNIDGGLDMVGAPPLVVRAFNLMLKEPEAGFVLLRNDYEYLINVPDQWRARPGLRRGANAESVPSLYYELAADFGVKRPEICYLHLKDCELLENWVGAGTYMATYTRMTTMESAAESGRHAAAALIFGLFEKARDSKLKHYKALAGDFPAIYPVEENEIEDLSFFTALDDEMFAAGLPHLFDVLGVTQLVASSQESDASLPQILARLGFSIRDIPKVSYLSPKVIGAVAKLFARFASGASGRT